MPKLPVSLAVAVCVCSLTAGEVFFDAAGGVGRIEFRDGSAEVSGPVSDWSGYDRLVLDFINNSYASPEDSLWLTAVSVGRPEKRHVQPCHYPRSFSTNRYWMAIADWPVDARTNVARLIVRRSGIAPSNFRLARAFLAAKDEHPPAYEWRAEDTADIEATNRAFRAAGESCRRASLAAFRAACLAAGQEGERFVGEARSCEMIRPRAEFSARPARSFRVRLARNERESFQVLALSGRDERSVGVEISPLRCGGSVFPASNVTVAVTGYVETKSFPPNKVMTADGRMEYPDPGWYPDPILDYISSCTVAKDDMQSFWVRVDCPAGQPAGVYKGKLSVVFGDDVRSFPLEVRVNDFSIPRRAPCRLAVNFSPTFSPPIGSDPEYVKMCNWKRWNPLRWAADGPIGFAHRRRSDWAHFLAGYGITVDRLYHCETNISWDALSKLKREGRLGLFNLGVWGENPRFKENFLRTIRTNHDEAKRRGLLAHAYIYGFDETPKSRFAAISNAIAEIKREFPHVPFLTTAFDPSLGTDEPALAPVDWFTPSITTNCYELSRVAASRRAGHKVWWYTCCFPHAPYPQLFLDAPPVETRLLLGAMAAKMKPDGFLYYQTAIWNTDRVISGGPFTDWPADSYYCYHGDGSFTCAGPGGMPLATQRLENFRDGLEDLWYARLLRRAKAEVPVPDALVRSTDDFSRDAALLERWREQMADKLEKLAR